MFKLKIKYFDLAIELLFLALLFLIPTIFDRRIGIVFSLTKTTILREFIPLILAIWSIKLVLSKKEGFVRTLADWPVLSYLLCVVIAGLASVHVLVSWIGFYGRYEGISTLLCYGLLFFIASNYIRSWDQILRGIAVVACSSVLMALYSVLQRNLMDPFMWGGVVTWERVIGTIGQPNFYAAYECMAFFLILGLYLWDKKGWGKTAASKEEPVKSGSAKHGIKKNETAEESTFWMLIGVGSFVLVQAVFFALIYLTRSLEESQYLAPGMDYQGMIVVIWYAAFTIMTAASIGFSYLIKKIEPIVLDSILVFALFLNYIGILFTQSRGGYMGFIIGLVLFFALAPRKFLFERWKHMAAMVMVLLLPTLVIMLTPEFSPFSRFASEIRIENKVGGIDMSTASDSPTAAVNKTVTKADKAAKARVKLVGAAGSRGETWKSAFGIIADNPLFGIGPEVLKMVFPRYETEYFRFREAFHVKQDRCHNSVFDVAVTRGLLAWSMYIWMLITVFWLGIRNLKKVTAEKAAVIAAILAAILSYKIQNQFSFGVVAIGTLYWVMLGWVARIDLGLPDQIADSKEEAEGGNFPWILAVVWLVVWILICWFAVMTFEGDKYFKEGRAALDSGRVEALQPAYNSLQKSVQWFPYEIGTYTHWGIAALNIAQQRGFNDADLKQAISILQFGSQVDPYNADNLHLLGKIYLMKALAFGQQKQTAQAQDAFKISLDYSTKAIKVDPYYAEVYYNRGFVEEALGQNQAAAYDYEQTFMINPSLGNGMDSLQRLLLREGRAQDFNAALERFMKKYPDNAAALALMGDWYMNQDKVVLALQNYERAFAIDPSNQDMKYKVINAKIKSGQGAQVVSLLQDAIQKNPGDGQAYFSLGLYYFQSGDRAQAKERLNDCLRLDPNNAAAQELLKKIK